MSLSSLGLNCISCVRNEHTHSSLSLMPVQQVFKAGKLICTTAATLEPNQSEEDLPFVEVGDGTIPFEIGEVIHGDILIRCRHLTRKNQRVSMFRAAFHTGYVPPNVLRLTKTQLDGACLDQRYPDDFFLDLIFEKVDAETASKHFEEQEDDSNGSKSAEDTKGKGPVVTASSFDTMLSGDSRVWDVISSRKREHAKQKNEDPLWGATVGRRRGESKNKELQTDRKHTTEGADSSNQTQFSIGNEFDFLPMEGVPPKEVADILPEKDALMDALNALDRDERVDEPNELSEDEEIVFDRSSEDSGGGNESSFGLSESASTKDVNGSNHTHVSDRGENPSTVELPAGDEGGISSTDNDDLEDMDALLATVDDDFGDVDLTGFDDDDDLGLDDLENMLKG